MDSTVYVVCAMDFSDRIIKVLRVLADKDQVNLYLRKRRHLKEGAHEFVRAFPIQIGLEDIDYQEY